MGENALDRLLKDSEEETSEKFTMDEMIEDTNFLNNMSEEATSALKEKLQPVTVDEDYEEEEEVKVVEENKEEVKKEEPKKREDKNRKNLRNKKDKGSKYDSFMNSLANECIDIMIQSGTTIHGFSTSQMNLIWDYIKERLN